MKKLNFILLFLILLMPMALAVKPTFLSGEFQQGYTIKAPLFEAFKVNRTYDFHVHVYNTTDGRPILQNIGCYLHVYNQSGNHIITVEDYTTSNTFDYEFELVGTNFSSPGIYNGIVACNNTNQGGFLEFEIPVTYSGYQGETNVAIKTGFSALTFILVLLGIMFLLVKVGKAIEVDDWLTFAIKILFFCFALGMSFLPLSIVNTMFEYSKNTIPSNTIASGLGTNAINLWNTAFGTLRIAVISLAIFGFIYVVYLIYLALLDSRNAKGKGFMQGGNGY